MNRDNEEPSSNAGVRLIKKMRQMGFRNKCLIFTSHQRSAENIIQRELDPSEREFVTVSTALEALRKFVNFDQKTINNQQPNTVNCYQNNASQQYAASSKLKILLNFNELRDAKITHQLLSFRGMVKLLQAEIKKSISHKAYLS